MPRGTIAQKDEPILGSLKKLAKVFSADEFSIDEKPVEVIDFAKLAQESAKAKNGDSAPTEETALLPAALEAKAAGYDLVSHLSEMLVEHGRLAKLAAELKPAGPQDDEFGRFARQAIQFLDGLDRVVEMARTHLFTEENSGWVRALEALYERVTDLFENYDLKVMNCLGQKVDFNIHDVIEYRRTTDYPHNTVIEEIRKGIRFRSRVIRDAKVIVACNEESPAD